MRDEGKGKKADDALNSGKGSVGKKRPEVTASETEKGKRTRERMVHPLDVGTHL